MSGKYHISNILSWINNGSERTAKLKKNVALSIFIKIGSILSSLVIVPMTIDFVNENVYGTWLTISSIVAWMSFFDIGFTNGLRNKFSEALALGDRRKARTYVSTTYVVLSVIFMALAVIMIAVVHAIDISPLLKLDMTNEPDLKLALTVLVLYFCITFVLRILSIILIADQQPARSAAVDLWGQLGSLLAVFIFKETVSGSLFVLSLALCIPPMLAWIVASVFYFKRGYRYCIPSVRFAERKSVRPLLGLGMKFFIIQIAAIIQFQTANVFIARLFSMESVTEYNIAYKYFNVLYMGFMILLQPFWSAVTNAYTQKDFGWIVSGVNKYLKLALLVTVAGVVMLLASDAIYKLWIGESVHISFNLSAWMLVYFVTTIFGAIFVSLINGIGALKIQYISSLISPLVFIALVVLFCKYMRLGMYAVLLSSVIANFNGLILAPVQYYKIVKQRKEGIWTA